jgi:hypothetical protein
MATGDRGLFDCGCWPPLSQQSIAGCSVQTTARSAVLAANCAVCAVCTVCTGRRLLFNASTSAYLIFLSPLFLQVLSWRDRLEKAMRCDVMMACDNAHEALTNSTRAPPQQSSSG